MTHKNSARLSKLSASLRRYYPVQVMRVKRYKSIFNLSICSPSNYLITNNNISKDFHFVNRLSKKIVL